MHNWVRQIAAVLLGAAAAASAGTARAQDTAITTVAGTTISVGGGVQFLSLPDVRFTTITAPSGAVIRRQKNDDFADYGGAVSGELTTPLGYWDGTLVTGAVRGFFASVDDDNSVRCTSTGGALCGTIDPTGTVAGPVPPGDTQTAKTERDVDFWGVAAEAKFGNPTPPPGPGPSLYRNDYFILGGDVRGLDQNTHINGKTVASGSVFKYTEQLDTTYSGGYIGLGGEYSLGFLGVGGLYDWLGLRSFVSARAGVYNANADYSGHFLPTESGAPTKLSVSEDRVAFIGGVTFETRKQLGARTSLSLATDYDYYSWAPEMRYSNGVRPTRIEDGNAFSARTVLRLNIGLGPSGLYPPQ
jgi:hypothetical protein